MLALSEVEYFAFQACESLLSASETRLLLSRHFDLLILDGAYPECAVALAYHFRAPFIFLNTVGFYTQSLALAGNPAPYAVTPYLGLAHSDSMTLWERSVNAGFHTALFIGHWAMVRGFLDPVIRTHLGSHIPPAYSIAKNVSFILQNGHFSVTYPRAYLPGVAEVACLHCKQAKPLPQVKQYAFSHFLSILSHCLFSYSFSSTPFIFLLFIFSLLFVSSLLLLLVSVSSFLSSFSPAPPFTQFSFTLRFSQVYLRHSLSHSKTYYCKRNCNYFKKTVTPNLIMF